MRYEHYSMNINDIIKIMDLSRNSPPATLKVLAPPTVLRGPQDTEVIEGEGLDLPCEVSFDRFFDIFH